MALTVLERDVCLAEAIAAEVARRGGRAYFVGGFVRDRVLGNKSKDVDVEILGLTPRAGRELLAGFGEVLEHGASFGVMGVRGYGADIFFSSEASVCEAALRRDLTMNALYEDILTHDVIDCFGGLDDLKRGVLRHVHPDTFAQDPLRVLRTAQFAARFDMQVDEQTKALCSRISLDSVARERVLEELRKALLKSTSPSRFFETLSQMGQLDPWFVELAALRGVPQNPQFHPEGDVWAHTLLVLDAAVSYRERVTDPFAFMLAALLHDVGKAQTTRTREDGRIVSYGHEQAGVALAAAFLRRLGASDKTKSYVLNMVELHMTPLSLVRQGSGQKSYNKLFDRARCPRDLVFLAYADAAGRASVSRELEERLSAFEELMARPHVQGRDLIELGVEPGPRFGEVLAYAHKLRLAGISKEEALRHCAGIYRHLAKRPSP